MGYWLEDADGEWLGDFATNKGIVELREGAGSALLEFLDDGEADSELLEKVIEGVAEKKSTRYVAEMLRGAKTPVFITDGCGDADE
jgi:hypothetical protein